MIQWFLNKKWARIIKKSGQFNVEFYWRTYPDVRRQDIDPIEHFVKFGASEGRKPNAHFDTLQYKSSHKELNASNLNPFVHYIQSTIKAEKALIADTVESKVITNNTVQDSNPSAEGTADSAASIDPDHKIINLIKELGIAEERKMIDFIKNKINTITIHGFFSSEHYLALYPDIKKAGVNPLKHFMLHGKREGRVGYVNLDDYVQPGMKAYDPDKETIVFASHESSATGAPLLGYSIAEQLSKKYNIVHIVIREKNIHEKFKGNCDTILSGIENKAYLYSLFFLRNLLERRKIKGVIINSIVAHPIMDAAHFLNLPILFLIHEFSEYMRPHGTMMNAVRNSDAVVTPAKIIEHSIVKEFARFANHKTAASNMYIIPQGKLPYIQDSYGDDSSADELYTKLGIDDTQNTKIIVGSGWVQPRKGVDLFVATARHIKKMYPGQCKFVWVGEGYDPDNDLGHSVYLQREIEHSGLGNDFVLLEHQKSLDVIFSIADAFILSSRMDPFPNVVIDALSHNLHIGCFAEASGSAEFLITHNANCTVVDYVDTYALASGITAYLESSAQQDDRNSRIVHEHLDFNRYVARLDDLINESVAFRKKSNQITHYLLESGEVDVDYMPGKGTAEEKCRRYVENGLKGLHFANPKPGFSETDWLAQHSKDNTSVVPLYEALRTGKSVSHKVHVLPLSHSEELHFTYAVHLHLYYPDMAEYFADYFKQLPGSFDLFITVMHDADLESIARKFANCGARLIDVLPVDNIGRDMGPFIFSLSEKLLSGNYEVIGHFHSKKSLHQVDSHGERWMDYLMQHLIGDSKNAADVLSLFNEPNLGLLFAEEAHATDIGENSKFVAALCSWLGLPLVEQTPLFPVGNMFWARLQAIKGLFDLESGQVLQNEPLPYDGSYMHALERITPHLVISNGYQSETVRISRPSWK